MSNLTKKGQRDLILVNRALKEGDRMAYNELMKLYRDPLYFMLYEKVNDQEVAKDLSIEALGTQYLNKPCSSVSPITPPFHIISKSSTGFPF